MTGLPSEPVILAGPIIRRATPERIHLWLATSQDLKLDAEIYSVNNPSGYSPSVTQAISTRGPAQTTPLQLGKNLWVHLFDVVPRSEKDTFPVDQLLAYDIVEDGGKRKLGQLTSLSDLIIDPFPLPTFVLPGPKATARIVYASCRKFHGDGEDAMLAAEELLKRNAKDPAKRAATLLLTGDQIYADDVADVLAKPLNEWATKLIGRAESLPGVPEPGKINVRGRARYLKEQAKFGAITSTAAHNHLLTFGEFAAMYLLAWNAELWPNLWDPVLAVDPKDKPSGFEKKLVEQKAKLDEARKGSKAARRVLANIATYMIFDDHEVTDDWYLNPEWTKAFLGNATGKRIILNALCAYWAFQAWGNTPQAFDIATFLNPISEYCRTGQGEAAAEKAVLEYKEWSYVTPTNPPVLVLDSRTGREGTKAETDWRVDEGKPHFFRRDTRAPRLLGPQERARIAGLLKPHAGAEMMVVVAPGPVFGVDAIETGIEVYAVIKGAAAADLESWRPNPYSFADLMRLLAEARLSTVAIVSGDVHYAFQVAARVSVSGQQLRIAQFTSSALKNKPTGAEDPLSKYLGTSGPLPMQGELRFENHWWIPSGEGPTARVPAAAAEALTWAKERFRRDADIVEQVKYLSHMGNKQIVLQHSNVGELIITGAAMTHRHWAQLKGQTQGLPQQALDPGSWPV